MNDDDFLDRLLNSSGDDLDRLIQNDKAQKKHKRSHHDIEVDMSDIEKILNSRSPLDITSSDIPKKHSIIRSSIDDIPDYSEECFKHVYDQLTTETYCIDRLSALQKITRDQQHIQIKTMVIKTVLIAIGICLFIGSLIWFLP